ILNAAKLFANFAAHYRLLNEVRDRVEAFFDRVALNQRAKNPGTQKTCAHSGNGDVERRNQRSRNVFARVVGENRCEQLEVADGNRVEHQSIMLFVEADAVEMAQGFESWGTASAGAAI